jgi:hypothetical protein
VDLRRKRLAHRETVVHIERKDCETMRCSRILIALSCFIGSCSCLHSAWQSKAAKSGTQLVRPRPLSDRLRGGATARGIKPGNSAGDGHKGSEDDSMSSHALDGLKNMLASGVASAIGKAMLQPFDSIKTTQQNSKDVSLSMVAAASIIWARGGLLPFYAGLGVSATWRPNAANGWSKPRSLLQAYDL